MSSSINKKELKNESRNFRTIANRVLTSEYDTFDNNLKRLVYHIDNNYIVKMFIDSCSNEEYNFEIASDVKQVSEGYGQYVFDSFIEEDKEVLYTYQILKYITDNNISFRSYTYPYSSSNKYNDKIKGFNDKFILPFINEIDGNFERIGVEMVLDEDTKYYINNMSGGQVNISADNSILNAVQNNYDNVDKLVNNIKSKIDSIKDNDIKNEIIDNAEGIQEEIKKENIKKGRIKSFINTLQSLLPKIATTIEVSAAITELITFAQNVIK